MFKLMKGHGHWLLAPTVGVSLPAGQWSRAEMSLALERTIDHTANHVLILDLGPTEDVELAVESLGKVFEPSERAVVI